MMDNAHINIEKSNGSGKMFTCFKATSFFQYSVQRANSNF